MTNFARGRIAIQSSTLSPYTAGLAVDGRYTNFTQTLSGQGSNALWEVNLSTPVLIDSIVLYNRGECCQDRLRDIVVSIRNSATGASVFQSAILNPGNVLGSPAELRIDLTNQASGRILGSRIRVLRLRDPELSGVGSTVDDAETLSLAEVEVNGTTIPSSLAPLVRTDLAAAMFGLASSCAVRIPFDDPWKGELSYEKLILRMRYNDGFVAYLNGTEVARQNAPSSIGWNSLAMTNRAKSLAFGFDSFDLSAFAGLVHASNNLLSIHGVSSGAQDQEFILQPLLEATAAASLPNQFLATDTPGVSNGEGFSGITETVSFSQPRGFYAEPIAIVLTTTTPGTTIRYTINGSDPSAGSGILYTDPISISKTTALRAVALKPGWKPSASVTHSYVFLDDVIRQTPQTSLAAGFPNTWGGNGADYGMDQKVIGPIGQDRYNGKYSATIKSDLRSLPTLSLVLNTADMFGPNGLYSHSDAGGDPFERTASAELILTNGATAFQVNAGLRVQGGAFRSDGLTKKHSLRLLFNSGHGGPSKLKYPLFGQDAPDQFDTLTLRANSNDGYSWGDAGAQPLYVRDTFGRETVLEMNGVASHHQFVHLYVNGLYWGMYEMVERPDNSFSSTYFGGPKEDWDALNSGTATQGDTRAWGAMSTLASRGLTGNSNYFRIQGRNPDGVLSSTLTNYLDVPNLIDYMIVNLYLGNSDWPGKNYWVGRRRSESTGFKFYMWDSEWSIGLRSDVAADRTGVADGVAVPYGACKSNPEFKVLFGDHLQRHFFNGGALAVDPQFPAFDSNHAERNRPLERFIRLTEEVQHAMVAESARWGDMHTSPAYTPDEHWGVERDTQIKSYFPFRSDIVLQQFRQAGLYPNIDAPVFSQRGGEIVPGELLRLGTQVGKIYYTTNGADPRLVGGARSPDALEYTVPIVLPGRCLVRARVQNASLWSALDQAIFTQADPVSLRITEIHYQPQIEPSDSLYFTDDSEFIELKNVGALPLDLRGIRFTRGISFDFSNALITQLAPGDYAILVRNRASFEAHYGTDLPIAGAFSGTLANGGDRLTLVSAFDEVIQDFTYSEKWHPTTAGRGFSLVIVEESGPLALWDQSSGWRASAKSGGSPGAVDSAVSFPSVVVSEVLARGANNALDAIELQNLSSLPADIAGWFLSDDPSEPTKFRIPAGTVLAPGGFVTFTETQFNPKPTKPAAFSLSSSGDQAWLFSADAAGKLTGYAHGIRFGTSVLGVSYIRFKTSEGSEFVVPGSSLTLSQSNALPIIGPAVITKIHPQPELGGIEFVEIYNTSNSALPLFDASLPTSTWKMNGIGWSFPQGVTLAPRGYCVVSAATPEQFRARYSVPDSVPVFGPFTGQIQNSGESIELQKPEFGSVPVRFVSVDIVRPRSGGGWPETFGTGACLARRDRAGFGGEPTNWVAVAPRIGSTLITAGAPDIQTEPEDTATSEYSRAIFKVAATGDAPLAYQWFLNGELLPGATQSAWVIDPVAVSNGCRYEVRVFNSAGSVVSRPAHLKVLRVPHFSKLSPSKDVLVGSGVTLTATATGIGPVRYQWFFQQQPLVDATNSTLQIPAMASTQSGQYGVQISDDVGRNTSPPILVRALTRPVILEAPQPITVLEGESVAFRVLAGGSTPMSFRWRKGTTTLTNIVFLGDQAGSQLTLQNVQLSHAGKYSVQVTNLAPGGTITSSDVQLTVLADADHDGMADAWELIYRLSPSNSADALLDPDQDGYSNLEEYRAGTDPTSAASRLRIESITLTNHQAILGWTAISNRTYSVLYRDSVDQGDWSRLQDKFNRPTNRFETVSDPIQSNSTRYHRLVTPILDR